MFISSKTIRPTLLMVALAGCGFLGSTPSLLVSQSPFRISPSPQDSNNIGLDVSLINTGPADVSNIGSFSFEIVASSSNISFTKATFDTKNSPYIFSGSSLFGPTITENPSDLPGTTLSAGDITLNPSGVTVAANSTVGLGRAFFDVSPLAPYGPITVSFITTGTSLSDTTFPTPNPITIDKFQSGTITVVPEPATLSMILSSVPVALWMFLRSRRSASSRMAPLSPF